jgi:hypothetical protein
MTTLKDFSCLSIVAFPFVPLWLIQTNPRRLFLVKDNIWFSLDILLNRMARRLERNTKKKFEAESARGRG